MYIGTHICPVAAEKMLLKVNVLQAAASAFTTGSAGSAVKHALSALSQVRSLVGLHNFTFSVFLSEIYTVIGLFDLLS